MAESDDSNEDGHKIISYEHQVTKINNHINKSPDHPIYKSPEEPIYKEEESYLKMIPVHPPEAMYQFNSCLCEGCGNIYQTPEMLMNHWETSGKCSNRRTCGSCKSDESSHLKNCKHYPDHEMPRVMFMDAGHLINYESHGMSSEAHQTEYETEEQPERYRCATSSSPKEYTSREDEEKVICPLPPPPNHDPQKPLPYRIDFLLNSGVVKHAKMNVNGKQNNSLYFEKKRPRKPRTHFTDIQIEDLEKVFEDKKYLSSHERQIIAHDLCLQEEQVKNWFQNRRSRWRKDCKDYKDAGEELTELVAANKVQDANQDQTAVAVGPNT